MKNKKNKNTINGFSATEFLTVIVVATILLAVILTIALDLSQKEKYRVMKYNAILFGYNVNGYESQRNANIVYLDELINQQLFVYIKNPFFGEKYCNNYDSFVEFEDETKYVTLSCGSYLIEHQNISQENFKIYKVSNWTTKKLKKRKNIEIEKATLYNYKKNKKDVLAHPYKEETFLLLFNQAYNTSYKKVSEIPKKYDITKEIYYRTKIIAYKSDDK